MEKTVYALFVLAGVTKTLVDALKPAWQSLEYQDIIDRVVAGVIAIGIAYAAGFNVLDGLGVVLNVPTWAGYVVAGVLAALGSNFLHDTLEFVRAAKKAVADFQGALESEE